MSNKTTRINTQSDIIKFQKGEIKRLTYLLKGYQRQNKILKDKVNELTIQNDLLETNKSNQSRTIQSIGNTLINMNVRIKKLEENQ